MHTNLHAVLFQLKLLLLIPQIRTLNSLQPIHNERVRNISFTLLMNNQSTIAPTSLTFDLLLTPVNPIFTSTPTGAGAALNPGKPCWLKSIGG